MFSFKLYLRSLVLLAACWMVINVISIKFEASSDGYSEMGLPFPFYRRFTGKCFNCKEVGFLWKGFLLDIVILLALGVIIQVVIRKARSAWGV